MSQQNFFIDKHFIHLSTRNTKNLKTELRIQVTRDKSKLRQIIHILPFHNHVEINKSMSTAVIILTN